MNTFEQWEAEQMREPEFRRAAQKMEWRYQLAWRWYRLLAAIRTALWSLWGDSGGEVEV